MPSGPAAKQKDNPSGDMAPFIIFMAFVIFTTVIVISIYRIKSEEDAVAAGDVSGFTVSLNAHEPLVFSDDFLFPGFFPVAREAEHSSRPVIQQNIVEARRLLADGKDGQAEDILRTLLLFYPDDIEIICLLSDVLRGSGRDAEAAYYDEHLLFLLPSAMPETLFAAPDAAEKRAPL